MNYEQQIVKLIEDFTGNKLPANYLSLTLRNNLNIASLDLIILATDLEQVTGIEINLHDLVTYYMTSDNPVVEDLTIKQILDYLNKQAEKI